jgi:outer membrane protein OmpA-like peptidoglycan-associated protein
VNPNLKLTKVRSALAVAATLLVLPAPASATGPFPLTEGFTGTTAPGWTTSGSAELTANSIDTPGDGWLRLTPAADPGRRGAAYNNTTFPSSDGVLVEFDYAAWGYTGNWPRGADGTSVFLFDASQTFALGLDGGGLGYTGCDNQGIPGVPGGYVGIGLDEYGNYGNSDYCGRGNGAGPVEMPNWVGVRGPTANNAPWLGGAPVPAGKTLEATRANKIKVTVAVADDKAYTWLQYADGVRQVVLDGVPLGGAAPANLKVGFAASTGGSNNNHEVRSIKVALPVDLSATATQQPSPGARDRIVEWDVTVSDSNLNGTDDAPVTLRGGGLTDIAWTCTDGTGGTCDIASGTGLSAGTVDLAAGGSVTYHVSAKVTGSADTADLGFEVAPGPANGELDPADNVGSVPVVLTPKATTPVLSHAADGVVTTTDPTWLGGSLTTSRRWQRCDPDGTACADIPGATGLTYTVGAQDAGKTLRAVFTATNAAGTTTLDTATLALPQTTIASGPAQRTTLDDATFAFTADGPAGTTLQCRLDDGAWTACTGAKHFADLADGTHTFAVRSVYGGLPDPTPATWTWTVDTTAPAAPALLAGPNPDTVERTARIEVGTEPDATLECALDGGAFGPCASPVVLSDLALGGHVLSVRQVDAAGNVGPAAEYRWTVSAKPVPPVTGETPSLDARISSRATVENGNTVGVGCTIAGDTVRSCTVSAYADVSSARLARASAVKRVLVGTGRTTVTGDAKQSVVVKVRLNATGRALVRSSAGGLKVRLEVDAKLARGETRSARLAATLLPRETVIVPVGPFGTARSALRVTADQIVRGLARDVRGAKSITCIGHTDARGSAAGNVALGKRRAQQVCRKLRKLGLKGRMVVRSAGESQPRATNATAAGMERNRRVEVRIAYA